MLSQANRDEIAAAVSRAEASTSGEIVCVLAQHVSTYAETPIAWAAIVALLAPPLAVAAGLDPAALLHLSGGWTAAHGAAIHGHAAVLGVYALAQAVMFALVAAIVSIGPVRLAMTPRPVKARRVREAAMAQLAAATRAAGETRVAVVIFAADAEHRVEVMASEAAHAAIGQATWDQAVAALLGQMGRHAPTEGFVEAVRLCGDALAEHFPHASPDGNAISDQPLEL